ncbi:MAG: flippase, partial [Alphaproteobacteria bacterium]
FWDPRSSMSISHDRRTSAGHLLSSRTLARGTIWNLFAQGIPIVVALAAVPPLVHGLGTDRFGILTLALAIIGYAGVFDMGLGRALTKLIADRLGQEKIQDLPETIWTALVLMLGLGAIGAVCLSLAAPWLARGVLEIPAPLEDETFRSLLILAASLPIVICSTGLRGVLEAFQRFDLTGRVRLLAGTAAFLLPLAVLPLSHRLDMAVAALALGRVAAAMLNLWYCTTVIPALRGRLAFRWRAVRPLLSFAGWLTVSNIAAPFITYMDRFLIAAIVSAAAVAYYGTSLEMVTRLWIIPGALASVLFPAFATTLQSAPERLKLLYARGVKYTFLGLFPVILLLVAFAREGLTFWLGPDFADHGATVLQWLAIGVFCNSLAQIAFALVQGCGRADITGKLHIAELPFLVPIIWWLTREFGIEGTAIGWTARVMFNGVILFWVAERLTGLGAKDLLRLTIGVGFALAIFGLATLSFGVSVKAAACLVVLSLYAVGGWVVALTAGERTVIVATLSRQR